MNIVEYLQVLMRRNWHRKSSRLLALIFFNFGRSNNILIKRQAMRLSVLLDNTGIDTQISKLNTFRILDI